MKPDQIMRPELYTCENCNGVFEKGWTDDEAEAEAGLLWTDEEMEIEGRALVCDDCFQQMLSWVTR